MKLMNSIFLFIVFCLAMVGGLGDKNDAFGFTKKTKSIIIDTDMAPDDWTAILYLLNRKEIQVKAITVTGAGESHCDLTHGHLVGAVNALKLITLANRTEEKIPVACGPSHPMQGQNVFPALWRNGSDHLLDLTLPHSLQSPRKESAVDLLIETLKNSKEKVDLLALGPLTNIALALKKVPALKKQIESITIMGGAVQVQGNLSDARNLPHTNDFAEWNIFVDPYSANLVFKSGIPIQLVPLDGTNHVPLTLDFLNKFQIDPETNSSEFIDQIFLKQMALIKAGSYYFWDSLAAAVLTHPQICHFELYPLIVVENDQKQVGRTKIDPYGNLIHVCTWADKDAFETIFLSTIKNTKEVNLNTDF